MLAMQYSISLPTDYDMRSIRDPVAKRGPTYDMLGHLGFKAFLITEKGERWKSGEQLCAILHLAGATRHARFLVWRQVQRAYRVCWPASRKVWAIIDVGAGNSSQRPTYATHELVHLAPRSILYALRSAELAAQRETLQLPLVHARAVAFDPSTWTLVRLTLWCI